MLKLHIWPTPNAHKVTILLEEVGLPYDVVPVNIGDGDQFKPEFLRISPNNKMPALVDSEGPDGKELSLFESGAILIYLAEKTGQFLSGDPRGRYQTIQWLMFQMGGVGPMLGQCHHFRQYAPQPIAYAIERYTNEAKRLYGVIDRRLGESDYLAGEYSIADMATLPWLLYHERQGVDIADYPHIARWMKTLQQRPAVQRGLDVMSEYRQKGEMSAKQKEQLFGKAQFERR